MPYETDYNQEQNLLDPVTRPIILVRHEHSGAVELASASGDVTFDGEFYPGGGVTNVEIEDSRVASFELFASVDRQSQVQSGVWRNGSCVIYIIDGVADESRTYPLSRGIEVINGKLVQSSYSGNRVKVSATHINNLNQISPRVTWDDICAFTPAPGTELVWEGERLILGAREIQKNARKVQENPGTTVRGRLPARDLQSLSQEQRNLAFNVTGRGTIIDVLYGERVVPGKIIALGSDSGALVVVVGWCWGEVESFEDVFINGAVPGGTITFGHHKGEHNQAVDTYLSSGVIPAWNEDLVFRNVRSNEGAAYSWFKIPASQLDRAPVFHAIIRGRRTYNPFQDLAINTEATYYNNARYLFDFTRGETRDLSRFEHPTTLLGVAEIINGKLFSPPGGGLELAYSGSYSLDTNSFSVEAVISPAEDGFASGSGLFYEVIKHNSGSGANRALLLRIINQTLTLFASSDGASYDIASNRSLMNLSGFSAGERIHILFRRGGWDNSYRTYINGVLEDIFTDVKTINGSSLAPALIGQRQNDPEAPDVRLLSVRAITFGTIYPAVDFNANGLPFPSDVGYGNNTARCTIDFIQNHVFGMGVLARGRLESVGWNETLIDGSTERCQISALITETRKSADYVDWLCDHAECVWYNEGEDVRLVPDKIVDAENPSGQLLTDAAEDFNDSAWILNDSLDPGASNWSANPNGSVTSVDMAGSLTNSSFILQMAGPDVIEADALYAVELVITARVKGVLPIVFGAEQITGSGVTAAGYPRPNHPSTPGTYRFLTKIANVGTAGRTGFYCPVAPNFFEGTISKFQIRRLYWKETGYVEGSLSVEGVNDADAPNSVQVRYTAVSSGYNWGEALTNKAQRPGVADGSLPEINTTLIMQGVFREIEAANKANARKERYINKVKYSWTTFDYGVRMRKADVVHLTPSNTGFDELVWVNSVTMVEPGRYKVTGFRYDVNHYPDEIEIPVDAGVVPVNLIMPLAGNTIPSGWAAYSDANGRYLIGAGNLYDSGDTGGNNTFAGFSGNTSVEDSHGDSPSYTQFTIATRPPGSEPFSFRNADDFSVDTDHSHTYDTGSFAPDLLTRRVVLAQKISSTSTTIPPEVTPLGLPGLLATGMSRLTSNAGRLLMAQVAASNSGVASKNLSFDSGSTDDTHDHTFLDDAGPAGLVNASYYANENGGGNHDHSYNLALSRNPKRTRVALYGGSEDMPVLPGMIAFWDEVADGAIPTNWVLCDGTNGTPNIQDRLIEIATEANEGSTAGNDQLSISGTGSSRSHDHRGANSVGTISGTNSIRHSNTLGHTHSINNSATWQPAYYALSAIMFLP